MYQPTNQPIEITNKGGEERKKNLRFFYLFKIIIIIISHLQENNLNDE
jgi:hypothetical protein